MTRYPRQSDSRYVGSYTVGDVGDGAIIQQGEHNIINKGATAVDVIKAHECGVDKSAAEVREISVRLGIAEYTINGFLKTMHEAQVPFEQVPWKFQELALRYQNLLNAVRTLQSDDPKVQRLKEEAAAAIEGGPSSYDSAEELLTQAEAIDRDAMERLTTTLEKRSLNAAATRAQRGELSLLRLDYKLAIEHFKEAVRMTPPSHAEVRMQHQKVYASALYNYGRDRDINHALEKAIRIFKSLAQELPRDLVPLDWAKAQTNLGTVLLTLAGRDAGTARLEQAVDAYRSALPEYTRDRVPLSWAMAQTNLGGTLRLLGERETGTVRLKEGR